jgi:predicted Ser/Thr protein kinase
MYLLAGDLCDNDNADFNTSTSQHQEDSTSEPDHSNGLTEQQRQIFNIYREAKFGRRKLPPIMLVTGPPGTGKTVLQDRIQHELKDTKAFATMDITAVVAGGSTFASTLHFSYDPNPRNSGSSGQKRKRGEADISIHPFTDKQLEDFCKDLDIGKLLLIVIDELSNVPPMIFAALDCRLRQATGKDEPFSGFPLFITGDFPKTHR